MPGRNGQRKPGTTRGSPRRSRTAKASRISRHAVKSRCARGWGGWGRLSDDGSRQHNSDTSEDPWGGGLPHLHGGALSRPQPDTVRDCCGAVRCAKGGRKPNIGRCMPGAGLSRSMSGKVPPYRPAFQPYRGKPAVRNDRGDRGNVGIMRSPVRASIPPDCIKSVSNLFIGGLRHFRALFSRQYQCLRCKFSVLIHVNGARSTASAENSNVLTARPGSLPRAGSRQDQPESRRQRRSCAHGRPSDVSPRVGIKSCSRRGRPSSSDLSGHGPRTGAGIGPTWTFPLPNSLSRCSTV
jgi:hypothetical protein